MQTKTMKPAAWVGRVPNRFLLLAVLGLAGFAA